MGITGTAQILWEYPSIETDIGRLPRGLKKTHAQMKTPLTVMLLLLCLDSPVAKKNLSAISFEPMPMNVNYSPASISDAY